MIEALAQTLCAMATLLGEHGQAVLTGVEKARFRGIVVPPCTLTFEVNVTERRFGVTWAKGRVLRGDDVVCTATLQAAIVGEDVLAAAMNGGEPRVPGDRTIGVKVASLSGSRGPAEA